MKLQHKVAIVTPRPQTTRRRILGIRSDADAQILLIDTPGLHEAKQQLNQRMVQTARRAIAEGEVILAVVEAGDHLNPGDRAVLIDIRALGRPTVVAINKVDRIPRAQLLPVIEEINRGFPGAEIVPVSARTGENVEDLLMTLKRMLPESPELMSPDEYTDQTERMIAEEIVREKIFLKMRQEIPFSTAVKARVSSTLKFSFVQFSSRIASTLASASRKSAMVLSICSASRRVLKLASSSRPSPRVRLWTISCRPF